MHKTLLILFLLITSAGTVAGAVEGDKTSITVDSVSLSSQSFMHDWSSTNPADQERARIYLLGVIDATEGVYWCDYKMLKSVSIRDWVFDYFRRLPPNRKDDRASNVIVESLKADFPCKSKERK